MATLEPIKNFDPLNIKLIELTASKSVLLNLLKPKLDSLIILANNNKKKVFNPTHLTANFSSQNSILSGLIHLILGKESNLESLHGFHFEFFCYYFCRVWNVSNEKEQNRLIGEIISGLKEMRQFDSLYFELIIAFFYLKNGNTVIFKDLEHSKEPCFDLEISNSGNNYSVEIKTTEYTSGLPFNLNWMQECIEILMNQLETTLIHWQGYHANIKFIGERQPQHEEMIKQINVIANTLNEKNNGAKTNLFEVSIKEVDSDYPLQFVDQIISHGQAIDNVSYALCVPTPLNFSSGLVTVTTIENWELPKKIISIIKEATTRQLPIGESQIIWIRLIGSTAMSGDVYKNLSGLSKDKSILQELRKRQNHKQGCKGLLGIHLTGDPFIFPHEDNKTIGMDSSNLFISDIDTSFSKEFNLYQYLVMKKTPPKSY